MTRKTSSGRLRVSSSQPADRDAQNAGGAQSASSYDPPKILTGLAIAYVASAPWDVYPIPFLPVGSPAALVGLILVAVWLWWRLFGDYDHKIPASVKVTLFLLPAWAGMTSLWSVSPSATLVTTWTFAGLVMSSLALISICAPNALPVVRALSASGLLLACRVLISPPDANRADRVSFDGIDENALALALSICLSAALYVIMRDARRHSVWAIPTAVALSMAIIYTGSRTGLGSLAGILLVSLMLALRSPRASFALGALGLGGWWILRVAVASGRVPQRALDFLSAPQLNDDRLLIIDEYLMSFDEWKWFGKGAGTDNLYLMSLGHGYSNAHSALWKTWVETGLIGLLIWALLIIMVIRGAVRSRLRAFLIVAAVPIVAFGYTLGGLQSNVLWVVLAVALAGLVRVRPTENETATLACERQGAVSQS